MRLLLLSLLLLAVPNPATACGSPSIPLDALVARARYVVLAEVVAVHDVAEAQVVEVRLLESLKNDLPGSRFFYPLFDWEGENESRREGTRLLLFVGQQSGFQGTRRFWQALDRLRDDAPFGELGYLGAMAISTDGSLVEIPRGVILPPTVETWQDPPRLEGEEAPVFAWLGDLQAAIAQAVGGAAEASIEELAEP